MASNHQRSIVSQKAFGMVKTLVETIDSSVVIKRDHLGRRYQVNKFSFYVEGAHDSVININTEMSRLLTAEIPSEVHVVIGEVYSLEYFGKPNVSRFYIMFF